MPQVGAAGRCRDKSPKFELVMRKIIYHQEDISDLAPGDILSVGDDSYVLEKLARGGMGYILMLEYNNASEKTYKNYLGHRLALKTVLPGFVDDGGQVLFKRELTVWSALKHPNIVQLIDIGICENNNFFAIMPWHNGSLRDLLLRCNTFSVLDSIYVIKSILTGLAYAFKGDGIIHLDIKPENILYDADRNISFEVGTSLFESSKFMIADWGISSIKNKILNKIAGDSKIVDAETLNNIGTVNYMAPERLNGDTQSTIFSDVYSVGMIFFEMLTGSLPINKDCNFESIVSGRYYEVAKQTLKAKKIPRKISETVLSMIAYSSMERPSDYSMLCDRLIKDYHKSRSFISKITERKILWVL